MPKDALYTSEREVKTFVDLFHGSRLLFEKSREEEIGSFFTRMSSFILLAFTFEAYLNDLGNKKIEQWKDIERESVSQKYEILSRELNIELKTDKKPYQTFKQLFKFRDSIAHGRSEIIKEEKDVSSKIDILSHNQKQTIWEKYCTEKNLITAFDDIESIILELNKAADLGDDPFISGMTFSSVILKSNNRST